jgi:hypothetical protein
VHRRQIHLPACSVGKCVHVDVGRVEHHENVAAGRQHLPDIGDAVLNAALRGATSVLSAISTL